MSAVLELLSGEPDELRFVVHSWASSYRNSYHGKQMAAFTHGRYAEWMQDRMRRLLERAIVVVAHSPEHSEQYLAWACGEATERGLLLHYVYAKSWERDSQLWLQLVADLEQRLDCQGQERRYTHRTHCTRTWERHGWVFAPHLVGGGEGAACKSDDTVH